MNKSFPTKEYWSYLLPMFILMMCSYATMMVDAAVGSHFLGPQIVAVVDLAMPITEIFYSITLLLGTGASLVASIEHGRGDSRKVSLHFTTAILSAALCLAFGVFMIYLFRHPILQWIAGESSLREDAYRYLMTLLPWFVTDNVLMIFRDFTILTGKPSLVMRCAVVQFLVNLSCNALFLGVLGFGVEGLAYSSLIGTLVNLLLLLPNYLRADSRFHLIRCSWEEAIHTLRTNIRFGSGFIGTDLTYIVFSLTMNALILRWMGEESLVQWSVIVMSFLTVNIASNAGFETCISLGGKYIGENQMPTAIRISRHASLDVTVWAVVLYMASFLFPSYVLPLFGASDPSAHQKLLPLLILAIPFVVMNNVLKLSFIPLLQQGQVGYFFLSLSLIYLQLPLFLALFHVFLPGCEWWSMLAMLPLQLVYLLLTRRKARALNANTRYARK